MTRDDCIAILTRQRAAFQVPRALAERSFAGAFDDREVNVLTRQGKLEEGHPDLEARSFRPRIPDNRNTRLVRGKDERIYREAPLREKESPRDSQRPGKPAPPNHDYSWAIA